MKGSAVKDKNLAEADSLRYAYRLLNYRGRSEIELAERLKKKGFAENTVRHTINHLKEKGFIDDTALALSLKRVAEDAKLLGARGVKQFLRHRGLSEEIINDILEEDDAEELARAKKLVDRKLRTMRNYSVEEIREKIWRFLVRKGYSFDTVRQTLKNII